MRPRAALPNLADRGLYIHGIKQGEALFCFILLSILDMEYTPTEVSGNLERWKLSGIHQLLTCVGGVELWAVINPPRRRTHKRE